jgi:NADH:ubiquinone oxidoreductase subunit
MDENRDPWVEYSDIHNPDASMIAPEWHGWMHHVFDEIPNQHVPFP